MKTYPLLQSQLGIFLEWIKDPSVTQYNLPSLTKIDKAVNPDRLEQALYKIFATRREMHTSFLMENGEPRQYYNEQMEMHVTRLKITEPEAQKCITHHLVKPYDLLSGEPLWRFAIIETPEMTYLFIEVHHVIGDGLTLSPNFIMNDLPAAYEDRELPISTYGIYEYAEDEQLTFGTDIYNRAADYYKEKYTGVEFVTLSTKYLTSHLGQMICESSFLSVAGIDDWCNSQGITPNLLFMAAFSYVISQLSRQDQIAYYTVNHGRMDKRLVDSYGMFVKSVPVMATVDGKQSIIDFIKGFRRELMSTVRYGAYPFNHFCRDLHVTPQISFGFQGSSMQEFLNLEGHHYITTQLPKGKIDDDLSCVIYIREGQYDIRLESSETLNSRKVLRQVADAIKACVQNMMGYPYSTLSELSIISEKEKQQLLELSRGEVVEYDYSQTFISLFKQQAIATPDAVAVIDKEGQLTYNELDRESDILAAKLIEFGIKPNNFVCIMLDYQKEFLISAIGVEKAGGAYVPLDYEYPYDRLSYMLMDSDSQVLITTHKVFDEKTSGNDGFIVKNILFIDDCDFTATDSLISVNEATPDGLAYMIYTSGSTGKPKGVMIPHRAKLNFVHFIAKRWGLSDKSRICCHSNFSFDASIEDLYPVLTVGGTLHILSAELRKDLSALSNYICRNSITGGCYTTQLGVLLASTYNLPLDYICLGGEKLASNPETNAHVYNTYGPTEFTVDATYFELEHGKEYKNIPIGRPLYNLSAFVVNKFGQLIPRGVVGELCMAGPQIAEGYWKREDLTAEKFTNCSFIPATKMYHTGDLVRWNEDGDLEYMGRIDNQVKLRGFRIELGEVESCTKQYEGIGMVSVQVKEIGSVQHLCCYFTADHEIDSEVLQLFLAESLTEYMVPTAYMQLVEMPLTPNGKVDTKALPIPKVKNAVGYVELEGEMENKIAKAFGIVLNRKEPIGALDNFFVLGGDSIKSIHLISVLRKENIQLSVPQIMRLKTVRALSTESVMIENGLSIDQSAWSGEVLGSAITNFFFNLQLPVPAHYNQAIMLRSRELINIETLKKALTVIVEHHDMLRTVVKGNDTIYVRANNVDEPLFSIVEYDETASLEYQANKLQSSIDLKEGPILKTCIFHTSEYDALLLVCHHLVVDGISWRIIIEDLNAVYMQIEADKEISLPQKTHSYKEYVEAIHRYRDSFILNKEKDFWKTIQQKMYGQPLSQKRKDSLRKSLQYSLDVATTTQLLNHSSEAYNTEINDLLIAAIGRSYYHRTGNNSLCVQLEGHGRESIDESLIIDRTVGWFTSIFPIIIENINGDIRHDIREVKEMLHRIPNKGLGYGILQYIESVQGDECLSNDMIPLMGFNYLGEFNDDGGSDFFSIDSKLSTGQLVSEKNFEGPGVNFDCMVVGGKFMTAITYDASIYSAEEAGQMAEDFLGEIRQIVKHVTSKSDIEYTASDLGCIVWNDNEFQAISQRFAERDERIERIYPLTSMQQGMLLKYQVDSDSTAYNSVLACSINILPTKEQLRKALDLLAQKHEVLRTSIIYRGVEEAQQAIIDRKLELEIMDVSTSFDTEAALNDIYQREMQRRFDLQDDALFRVTCVKTSENSCQLLFMMYHIIIDGWCLQLCIADYMQCLVAVVNDKALEMDNIIPGRYEAHIRRLLQQDKNKGLEYWRNLLDGYSTKTVIPSYGQVAESEKSMSDSIMTEISGEELNVLQKLCADEQITMNTIVELAWGLVLQMYNRTEDAVFVKIMSGRNEVSENVQDVVGLFINSVPIRIITQKGMTVHEALQAIQAQAIETNQYDYCSLSEIQQQTLLGNELFQSILAFENYPSETPEEVGKDLNFHIEYSKEDSINDIAVTAFVGDTLRLQILFDNHLYRETDMQRLLSTFKCIVQAIATDTNAEVQKLNMVNEKEEVELLQLGQGRLMNYDQSETMVDLLINQARKTPDAIAVVFEEHSFTYREIDDITTRLAIHLQGLGVTNETVVGVMIDRSELMLIYPIAIMKAGGAYMPLDFHFPEERLMFMLEDANVKIILSEGTLLNETLPNFAGIIFLREELKNLSILSSLSFQSKACSDGSAVILYTSGSTGKPKGVVLEHHGIVNFAYWYASEFNMTAEDRSVGYASFGFDAHMIDIYPTLLVGGTVYIISSTMRMDLVAMNDYMNDNHLSIAFFTTQIGYQISNVLNNKSLRLMSLGGEKLQPCKQPPYCFYNVYGPTECSLFSTYFNIEGEFDGMQSYIGLPLANYRLYVLDKNQQPVPRGVVGELVIAGSGVARGYLNRPELTAEKFITIRGEKAYRSGDLVRWADNNNIEFIGRIDNQVKLRGLRIEIGEIESLVNRYQDITSCAVDVKEMGVVQSLCCYFTADSKIETEALKTFLAKSLTDYMVPTVYMQMEKMPLNPNGKINRKELPLPEIKLDEIILPETDRERELFDVISEKLKIEKFGVTNNLLSLGLTSLTAMRLSAIFQQQLGLHILTKDIMKNPSVRQLAQLSIKTEKPEVGSYEYREFYPLTENQRGVYIDWEQNREALQYNVPMAFRFEGVNVYTLAESVEKVIKAHPYLNTHLAFRGDDVVQLRLDDESANIILQTLDQEVDMAFLQSRVLPFDLFNDILYRIEIYKTPSAAFLFMDIHHLIYDGVSSSIFLQELTNAYAGQALEVETYTAFDRAIDEEHLFKSERYKEAESYFDQLTVDTVSIEYPHSLSLSGTNKNQQLTIDEVADKETVDIFCSNNQITANSFFLTILTQVLHRITREDNVMITSISNGREDTRMLGIMGMFVKTLPIISKFTKGTFAEATKKMHNQLLETLSRDFYPFTHLVQRHQVKPRVMFSYQGGLFDGIELIEGKVEPIILDNDTVKFPLTVTVSPNNKGTAYTLQLDYNDSFYNKADMKQLAEAMSMLINAGIADHMADVSRLSIVTVAEKELLLKLGTGREMQYDRSETLVDILVNQTHKTPDAIAIVFREHSYTYKEIDEITTRLAIYLQTLGVGHDSIVGVMIDRSEYMLIYPMAIMKAGGAYMPLDSHFPADRLMFMCEDAEVDLILSEENLVEEAIPDFCGRVFLRSEMDKLPELSDEPFICTTKSNDRHVILFTSGSTGKPKGVVLEHHGMVNFCHWYVSEFNMTVADRSVAYANFGFDAHIIDIYPTLLAGGSIYILPSEMRMDLVSMNDYIEENHLTIAFLTTQIGCQIATLFTNKSLRVLSTGGEKMPPIQKPAYRFYNVYGPTECSLFSTFYNIEGYFDGIRSIIGRPLANYHLYVVDKNLQLVPRGVAGELVISGVGVARGYLNRADLTAEKFILIEGDTAYRSGDLVRWTEDGDIEFLGRIDNQVKLRGLRIELGEIEALAAKYKGVRQVVVDVKDINEVQHLCCYFVADHEINEEMFKAYLGETLTEFMVPTSYIQLETLPLTPNGKVNRKVLPVPEIKNTAEYIAPSGKIEVKIAELFATVLNRKEPVGAFDSFFALGGDSIKSIRLASLLRQAGIVLQVSQIMKHKTVRDLAKVADVSSNMIHINQGAWSGDVPNSAIVQYFFDLRLPVAAYLNQSIMLRGAEPVDVRSVESALAALVEHHDMLRAIVKNDHLSVRASHAEHLFDLIEYDVTSDTDVMAAITILANEQQASFDLEHGPMLKAVLFHTPSYDALLLICHHLVVDGVSWRILVEDFNTAYSKVRNGETVVLPQKTHSYKEYTEALYRYRKSFDLNLEKDYWTQVQKKVRNLPLSAGTDYNRVFGYIINSLDSFITSELLGSASLAYYTEINDLLLTAFGRSYQYLTGNTSLSIQLEGHGREPINESLFIDRTVGWFTSIYPVVLENLGNDIRHDIRIVKETMRRIPNKGFGYGQLMGIDTKLVPLFGFNYLGELNEGGTGAANFMLESDLPEGVQVASQNVFGPSLSINCLIQNGQLTVSTTYDIKTFSREEATNLCEGFIKELHQIVNHTTSCKKSEKTASDLGENSWSDVEFESVYRYFQEKGEPLQRIYPLNPMQEGMLLKYMAEPDSTAYRILSRFSLNLLPTREQLRYALDRLAAKHEVLRTSIIFKGVSEYRQAIVDRKLGLRMVDITTEKDQEEALDKIHRQEIQQGFDLEDDSLLRVVCIKISDNACKLLFAMHHIILDGWCLPIFMPDFQKFLMEAISGQTNEIVNDRPGRYETFIRKLLRKDKPAGLSYWRTLLADYQTKAVIPSYGPVPAEQFSDVETLKVDINPVTVHALNAVCSKLQVTLNTAVELAWGLVLQAYNRNNDAVFVKVVSGRNDVSEDVQDLVGLFINSVPVRITTTPEMTVQEALLAVQTQAAESNAYDFCPLAEIQQQTDLGSDLFQSIIAFENFPGEEEDADSNFKVEKASEEVFSEMGLTAYVGDDNQLSLHIRFERSLYRKQEIERVLATFDTIIQAIVSSPDSKIQTLPLVSDVDIPSLMALSKGKDMEVDTSRTFAQIFTERAALVPDAVAVVDKDSQFTYSELDKFSNIMAARLIESGVKPDTFICIMLDRRKEFVLSVLAIHKVGCGYTPLDFEYPNQRLLYMLENSESKVLITSHDVLEEKQKEGDFNAENIFFVDDIDFNVESYSVDLSTPEGMAYMIYTSGSTGKPKGAMIHQKALVNFIHVVIDMANLTAEDRISGHRSFSFDAHIEDMYPILTLGGSFHIMPTEIRKDLSAMYDFIVKHNITGGGYSTAIGALLLNTFDLPVRFITAGGEKLDGVKSDHIEIINVYGPTECTDDTNYFKLEKGKDYKNIPIGRPVANNWCFIVGPQSQLLPRGVAGELCFAGVQVGRGYWNLPERTAQVFVDCPFIAPDTSGKPVRMYHTGDLCRWNEDGDIEYISRIDNQVKLRGFRIELGEIESEAGRFKGLLQTVADVRNIDGTIHLCLYYTVMENMAVNKEELHTYLEASPLAEYMVPEIYIELPKMPLTPNGKINRKALPAPSFETNTKMEVPSTVKEQVLYEIVCDLLHRRDFGVTDSLPKLGMTSLVAIRIAMAADKHGILLKVNDIIKQKTIRNILGGDKAICYWANAFTEEKPVVVLVYGMTPYNLLVPLLSQLSQRYSVICIETILDHYRYIFEDVDLAEVVEMYYTLLDYHLTANCKIHAFVGHCFGGEIAYRLASHWQKDTDWVAPVFMFDTYWTGVVYDMSNAFLLTIPEYILKKYENEIDKGIEQNRIGASLRCTDEVPKYPGRVIYYKALQDFPLPFEKELLEEKGMDFVCEQKTKMGIYQLDPVKFWKDINPQMEYYGIDGDHFTMMKECFISEYMKALENK